MSREELLKHICFSNYTSECSACDGRYSCQDCKDAISPLLDEYDKQIMAELLEPYDVESIEDLIANVRNKTIDEFAELCLKHKSKDDYPIMCFDEFTIKQFVKQLKGGAENGEE